MRALLNIQFGQLDLSFIPCCGAFCKNRLVKRVWFTFCSTLSLSLSCQELHFKQKKYILISYHKVSCQFKPPVCRSVTMTIQLISGQCLHMNNVEVPPLSQFAWMNTDQRKPAVGWLLVQFSICTVQVAQVWRQQRTLLLQSLRVTSVSRTIQSRHCAGNREHSNKSVSLSPLLATLWRVMIIQAPLSLTILFQHMCAGAFSFHLLSHIKAHFLFSSKKRMVIFIKPQTHAFLYLRSFEDLACSPDVF